MIAYLSGRITFRCPTHIHLETGGIGYLIKITLHGFERLRDLEHCTLHTSLVVKSENQSVSGFDLYGFMELAEKELFDKLLSVSGVGAATARMMLSTYKPEEIQNAILMENEVMIQQVKGIGPKSAKRIILELKDKMGKVAAGSVAHHSPNNMMKEEALFALQALGFQKPAAEKVLLKLMNDGQVRTVEQLIKEALKLL